MEMPPLELMVLDALADDEESVETMRDHGQVAPHGLALVGEDDVIAAVNDLLTGGLIEALEGGLLLSDPRRDPSSLRRYWFRPTEEGRRALRKGEDLLDAYWKAHPI